MIGDVGGALGLDGTIQLQWVHWFLMVVMADVIPGQKTEASTLASMERLPDVQSVEIAIFHSGVTIG